MPTLFHKTCPVCTVNFSVVSRYKKKIFCSRACHLVHVNINTKSSKLNHCTNCGGSILSRHSKKFCCQSCAAHHNNKNRDIKVRGKQRATLMSTLTCKGLSKTDAKDIYKDECAFKFNVFDYPNLPGYQILKENGIYNYASNPQGVVRDHIISKEYGWKNNIPANIISHPANCQLISNLDNVRKGTGCDLSYEDLLTRIDDWQKDDNKLGVISSQRNNKKPPNKNVAKIRQHRYAIYKWILQNVHTNTVTEVTQIAKWLKTNGYTTSHVYGKHAVWKIIEKYNLRTGEKII